MSQKKIRRQYGLWESPVSPTSLGRGLTFSDVAWAQDGTLVWREGRSDRGVLVVQPPGKQAWRDLNGDLSVRAGVGYGGGDFSLGDGSAFFVDAASGRMYRQPLAAGTHHSLTPAFGRYAAAALSPDGRWLLFVHSYEDTDVLGIVDSRGEDWPFRLASGQDFYMQPCWHPDNTWLAWVAWDFPNMPWDGTTLYLGRLSFAARGSPSLEEVEAIAGGEEVSVFQPQFSPDGRSLAYVSDQDGWWQLYLYDLETRHHRQLTHEPAEHGLPAWAQGLRSYGFDPGGKSLFFIRNQAGANSLWRLELSTGGQERLPLDEAYTSLSQPAISPDGRQVALLASGSSLPARVVTFDVSTGVTVWRRSTTEELPQDYYSLPQHISWEGLDGGDVFGVYYPPCNPDYESPGLPPLVVSVHGGPTSQRLAAFSPQAQFFTSRGYGVLEVNYRGSTGYGRDYRNRLRGSWGVYDVQDSVSGARWLVEQGRVDGSRMVILGGSAGGFTVLKALEDYPGVFKAGVCLYGVSNQFTLAADTHKFEARYSDTLLGPLPEAASIYRERSPVFFADRIQDPIAIFQGEDDVVVPRAQSDDVVASLRRRGVPHEYHLYPGEGHGFRKQETIEHYYKAVDKFLRQYVIYA